MTDQVTIKNGAFVAMAWSAQSEEIRTLFERDPEAALAGMLEAAVGDEIRLFSLDPYLDMYSVEDLERAGTPESVVARKRMLSEQPPEPSRPRMHQLGGADPHARRRRARTEIQPRPTLWSSSPGIAVRMTLSLPQTLSCWRARSQRSPRERQASSRQGWLSGGRRSRLPRRSPGPTPTLGGRTPTPPPGCGLARRWTRT